MARSSAKSSSSSAAPPRSPLKVLGAVDLIAVGWLDGFAVASDCPAVAEEPSVGASLDVAGGAATTTSKPADVARFVSFLFHGGRGRSVFLLGTGLSDASAGAPEVRAVSGSPGGATSPSSAKRSALDLLDTALSSANKAASSAEPPRSPRNVLGRSDVIPFPLDTATSLRRPSILESSALHCSGNATTESTVTGLFFAPFLFQGGRGLSSSVWAFVVLSLFASANLSV
mmetsp:Transcript_14633/g.32171  ORF Transcript_14633/g.32171 Transcript_14633/m.32171 type:complete len:229 (+) Transcript_14633:4340-5026(+)